MVFSSLEFIFQFLPIFLLIYFLCPARYKNFCLFAGSMLFYLYGVWDTPLYLALFGASMAVNYFFGCRIARSRARFRRRKRLFWGVAYNLFWLLLFKYTGFFTENINGILRLMGLSLELPVFAPVLPVGISFYTFQAISYLADVYRKTAEYEPSFVNFAMYISMFPQLIAGPIVTYSSIKKEISRRSHSMRAVEEGLKTFTIGLGLKVLLANRLGGLWNEAGTVGYESISTPFAWLAITAFSLQIYFDFYGYSLMAKGLGRIMGFTIPENFHDPYLSLSMTEFWRRWHMTLGSWFRDYVYIPLGGNRCSRVRKYFNIMVTFLTSGIWHGASWHFVLWGALQGIFIVIGDMLRPAKTKFHTVFHVKTQSVGFRCGQVCMTYLLFLVSFTFFRAPTISDGVYYLERIVRHFDIWALLDGSVYTLGLDAKEMLVFVIAVSILWIVDWYYQKKKAYFDTLVKNQCLAVQYLIVLTLFVMILVFGVYGEGYNASEFIYFQF